MTPGQSNAVRAQTMAIFCICEALERRGLLCGADVAALLRQFADPRDPHLMETVEAMAQNLEHNPFGPAGRVGTNDTRKDVN